MAKQSFLDLVKNKFTTLLDPERDERRKSLASAIHREVCTRKRSFSLKKFVSDKDINEADLSVACERVYVRCAENGWKDLTLSDGEEQSLRWLAEELGLSFAIVSRLNSTVARDVFEAILAEVIEDGHVDREEHGRLRRIAEWSGSTVRGLMQGYFQEEGEAFIRGMFIHAAGRGELGDVAWDRLISNAHRLGFSESELLEAISSQAQAFVEHVLADAKSDGDLSRKEYETLAGLIKRFRLPKAFEEYVWDEIGELNRQTQERRQLEEISRGRLPSLGHAIPIELRAGEIVHFHGRARHTTVRELKSGPRVDKHQGTLTITDSRIVFSSETKSVSLNLRSIIGLVANHHEIEVRASSKGAGLYSFLENRRIGEAILRIAVGKANQTIVEQILDNPTRHIPREIRQRTWQKYGGKCVDCGANQYLEFDHIIPVAKGGGNTEANVQLLCRRCNLKKSDRI